MGKMDKWITKKWVVVYRYGTRRFESKEKTKEYIKELKKLYPREVISLYSPRAKRWYSY